MSRYNTRGGGGGGGGGSSGRFDTRREFLETLIPQRKGLRIPESIETIGLDKVIGLNNDLFLVFLDDQVTRIKRE